MLNNDCETTGPTIVVKTFRDTPLFPICKFPLTSPAKNNHTKILPLYTLNNIEVHNLCKILKKWRHPILSGGEGKIKGNALFL